MKKEDQKKTKKDRPRKHKAADEDEDASAKKPTNQFKNVERATQTYNKCTKVNSQCIWIVDSYKQTRSKGSVNLPQGSVNLANK